MLSFRRSSCWTFRRYSLDVCHFRSRTEARSLAEFKCSRCSLVNTFPQCQNSRVVHLKRVRKKSRIPLAENLIPKINDNCETPSNIALWCLLHYSPTCFLLKPPRRAKRQRSSLSSIVNKHIGDGVIQRNTETGQNTAAEKRVRSTTTFHLH